MKRKEFIAGLAGVFSLPFLGFLKPEEKASGTGDAEIPYAKEQSLIVGTVELMHDGRVIHGTMKPIRPDSVRVDRIGDETTIKIGTYTWGDLGAEIITVDGVMINLWGLRKVERALPPMMYSAGTELQLSL